MKSNTFNGFKHSIIIDMYSFICRYQKIKGYQKDLDLKNNHPQLHSEMSKLLKRVNYKHTKQVKWEEKYFQEDISACDTFYFDNKSCIIASILYHIRNSIAHGNIICDKELVRIYDYGKNGKRTANALIKMDNFKKFLNIINDKVQL